MHVVYMFAMSASTSYRIATSRRSSGLQYVGHTRFQLLLGKYGQQPFAYKCAIDYKIVRITISTHTGVRRRV